MSEFILFRVLENRGAVFRIHIGRKFCALRNYHDAEIASPGMPQADGLSNFFDIDEVAETIRLRHARGRYFSIVVVAEGAKFSTDMDRSEERRVGIEIHRCRDEDQAGSTVRCD